MAEIRIKDINISIWNHQTVQFSAHLDVNIIMGINGSGKTTFLSSLYKSLTVNMKGTENVVYLPSIDNIAMRDKRKNCNSPFTRLGLLHLRHEDRSFIDESSYVND